MPELTSTFTALYAQYGEVFRLTTHEGADRANLMQTVPGEFPGVYLIWKKGVPQPLYIGSSGKIGPDLSPSGSNVKRRLFGANTPYHFDKNAPVWRYGPTTAGVPPAGYFYEVPISDLRMSIFALPPPQAPAVLEHLLLQGFINEFGRLPVANQKI